MVTITKGVAAKISIIAKTHIGLLTQRGYEIAIMYITVMMRKICTIVVILVGQRFVMRL